MNTIRNLAAKVTALVVVGALFLVGTYDLIRATNTTKAGTSPSITGFGGVLKFSGTMRASAVDTQYCPINGKNNTRDSIMLVIYNYTFSGTRTPFSVRLQQSMNNITWKTSTIGTDSNSYSTTATTLKTANANAFQIGDARYGTWPYNRLLLTNTAAVTTDSTRYEIYVSITKNSQ